MEKNVAKKPICTAELYYYRLRHKPPYNMGCEALKSHRLHRHMLYLYGGLWGNLYNSAKSHPIGLPNVTPHCGADRQIHLDHRCVKRPKSDDNKR